MNETWESASQVVVDEVFDTIVDADGTNILREHIDYTIENLYNKSHVRPETFRNNWKLLGATAISLSVEFNMPLTSQQVASTLIKKQRDYGHENIKRFGREGLIIRCHDKIARLENLCGGDFEPENEPIQDTLLDIVGYSALGMMWEDNTFLLPLADPSEKSSDCVLPPA